MADESAEPTPDDVRGILEGPGASITKGALEAHISAASDIIGDIKSAATLRGISVPDSRLKNVHMYLAAHIATSQAPRQSAERDEAYRSDWLRETDYGQVAMQLDPTGALSDSKEDRSSISTGSVRGRSRRGYRRL